MQPGDAPNPGDLVAGKYRIERVIGIGGMGMVYAAQHVELARRVAVKVMMSKARGSEPVERFRREARAVARLQSAHVAHVIDFGELESGAPFVVMEYLEGRDLGDELAARGPLPVSEAVHYVLQACEGLAEAHGLGIVHRDLKPKNLFIAMRPGGTPVLKLLDFGLAKMGPLEDGAITRTTDVFGSPTYMSPEQMRSAKDVDARTDVWAMGVTLYELLAGKPPFDAGSVAEICAMVLKESPVWLGDRREGIPRDLARVVHRCLSKDPNGRYPTVFELSAALEPFRPYDDDVQASRRIRAILASPSSGSALTASEPRVEDVPTSLASTREARGDLQRTLAQEDGRRKKKPALALVAVAVVAASAVGLFVRASLQPSRTGSAILEPSAASAPTANTAPGITSGAPASLTPTTPRMEVVALDAGVRAPLPPVNGLALPHRSKPATKPAPAPRPVPAATTAAALPPPPVVNRSRPGDTL